MEIRCPLVTQNLAAETPGTLKMCCEMKDITAESTGEIITRKTHTAQAAFSSPEFQQIRENFKKGIRDPHCAKCWQAEDRGTLSRRLLELESVGHLPNVDLKYMTISLGNTCNIKCRTCGSRDSTFWLKEEYDLDVEKTISFRDYKQQNTVDLISDLKFYDSFIEDTLPNLKDIGFLGGEPLMIPEFWNIIEKIIEKGLADQITLNISTNCTIWEQRREHLLSKFKNVNIFCSIDGIGKRFEYMRHPARWSAVSKNLEKMLQWRNLSVGKNLILIPAVSAYNVWYLDEILEYAKSNDMPIQFRPVVTPDYMDTAHIPEHAKKLLEDRLPELIRLHMTANTADPAKWQEFLESVRKHDRYRGESFAQIFEEYAKILDFEE